MLIATIAASSLGHALAADDGPLVVARDLDFPSLDPQRAFCDSCMMYNSAVYQSLVTMDKDNKVVPVLASKWEISPDQTKFTFTIDPQAKFADGSPVESKDVEWSWERLKNLKGSAAFYMASVAKLETPDPKTLVVTTKSPNSEFIGMTASSFMNVVNSNLATQHGAKSDETAPTTDTSEAWFLTHSAGSGPFVLDGYEPNVELRLERNEAYWRKPPAFKHVVIREVKDAVSQVQMLQNGTADIAMQIDPETAKALQGSNVRVETAPSFNFIYVALSPGAKANKVPLSPEVREAISLALDRKGILDLTLGGQGRLISTPIPLGFPGSSGFEDQPTDIEKAKALLANAGYPDGFELAAAFPALNVYGVDLSLLMQKVQQDLAKIGIKVTLEPMQFSNWRERVSGDGIPLTAVYYAPDYFGTSQYLDYFAMTPGTPWSRRAGASRDPSILNPRVADLYKKALAASGDEAEKLWHQAGQEMINDRIILTLVSPDLILTYNPDIKGVRYNTSAILSLAELSR
ncbi:ABC transporter substrate-binding protein [Mesorhizobium sp. B3-1-3]|nr:ABC transporter substrate-binding protein [Mesorhizobium sp. B3-1-8]TPI70601.1 ABC transporter substrate-binding protein [Mesorhizobium sp. B3-1-3]